MSSTGVGNRRFILKACGCIQIFLGLSAFGGAISAVVLGAKVDLSYSGFWSGLLYIFLGMLSIQGSRFDDYSQPHRGMLLACMVLNLIVSATSVFNAIWFIISILKIGRESFDIPYGPATGKCLTIVVSYAHAILVDSIIRTTLIIPVCIMAALTANKLRNAVGVTTTTHHVAPSAPAQPYVTNTQP